MSGEIRLDIASDTKSAIRGIDDVAKALGVTVDELEAVAKAAGKTSDDVVRDFRKIQREAADVDAGSGFKKAGEASGEFKQEALANLSEVTSSFTGDLSSIGDLAQGTFGGLAALGGGFGLAAGGVAAGIGLIISSLEQAEEARKALEERANDLANAYIEAGNNVLDALTLSSRTTEVLTDPEQRKEAERLVDVLGVQLPEAARLLAGDTNTLAAARAIVTENEAEYLDLMKQSADYMNGDFTKADQERLSQLSAQREAVRQLTDINGQANETFRAQQGVLKGLINDAESATVEVDELGNELYTLPDGTQIMIDAETGQATTDVQKFKGDLDGIAETKTTKFKVTLDDGDVRSYRPPTIYVPGRIVMPGGKQVV
jgi:NACalpha-BTF3-like transcription factor